MKYTAQKDQITPWLAQLAKSRTLLAPKKQANSVTYQVYSGEEMQKANIDDLLEYTTASPKKVYLPQTEVLFEYKSVKHADDLAKRDTTLSVRYNEETKIIFGTRPCDAKGVYVQDAAYLKGPYKDPYYAATREKTVLITQACNQTLATCFCNWTDTDLTNGYVSDILFTVTARGAVFEALTDKGKELLAASGFVGADDQDIHAVEETHAKAHADLPEKPDLSSLPEILNECFDDKELWAKVTAGCIGCNSCTYVCPTCQCFTITDEGNPLQGKRIRSWASCMSSEFTREASGHNPRSVGFTRWRNRLGHKFNYMLSMHEGLKSCTGCGRCMISCPASIGIQDMILQILADSSEKKKKI